MPTTSRRPVRPRVFDMDRLKGHFNPRQIAAYKLATDIGEAFIRRRGIEGLVERSDLDKKDKKILIPRLVDLDTTLIANTFDEIFGVGVHFDNSGRFLCGIIVQRVKVDGVGYKTLASSHEEFEGGVTIIGSYGLEHRIDGVLIVLSEAIRWAGLGSAPFLDDMDVLRAELSKTAFHEFLHVRQLRTIIDDRLQMPTYIQAEREVLLTDAGYGDTVRAVRNMQTFDNIHFYEPSILDSLAAEIDIEIDLTNPDMIKANVVRIRNAARLELQRTQPRFIDSEELSGMGIEHQRFMRLDFLGNNVGLVKGLVGIDKTLSSKPPTS